MENMYEFFMMFSIYIILGLLSIFMPYFTRRTESFGVSIPEEEYENSILKELRKKYVKASLLIVVLITGVSMFFNFNTSATMSTIYFTVGLVVLMIALFAIYLKFHFKMKELKDQYGWYLGKQQAVVMDTSFRNEKVNYSNLWFMIPSIIAFGMAFLVFSNYDKIPQQIPMQFDFQGNVTNWREKSYYSVFLLTILQFFMIGLFIFVNTIISKAKQQISATNPEKSIAQNRIFRKRWSAFTIIMGTGSVLLFAFTQATMLYGVSSQMIMVVTGVFTIAAIIGASYLAITTGQGGSRVNIDKGIDGQEIDRDDDKYWKLGKFYYNPDDPAIFIEKRFGIGWTFNFARAIGWSTLLLLLLIIVIMATIS